MKTLKAVDLFAGIGGLTAGFQKAGVEVIGGVEIDGNATSTYTQYTGVPILVHDVAKLGSKFYKKVKKVDAVIGGPPCQGFSDANRSKKKNGNMHPATKNSWCFFDVIERVMPQYFVMENVLGITSVDNGKIFSRIMRRGDNAGYVCKHIILNAKDYGVPQCRKRFFLFGFKKSSESNVDALSQIASTLKRNNSLNVWDAISDLPKIPPGERGRQSASYISFPKTNLQRLLRGGRKKEVENHVVPKHSQRVIQKIALIPQGKNLNSAISSFPLDLRRDYKNPKAVQSNIYRRLRPKLPSPTIVHPRRAMLIHPYQDRIISVREAARIQGIHDRCIFLGTTNEMYQRVANAVPPNLGWAVAKILLKCIK